MTGGRRILVVDDEDVIRRLVRDSLSDEGYEVITADTGQTALDLLAQGRPDLILLDLMMPSMNGRAFCTNLPEHHRDIPILLLSGSNDLDRAVAELGVAGGLRKPFDLDDLLTLIHRTMPL